MNIAFCVNSLGLTGLGATISSLIRNCSNPGSLHLWFLCAGLKDAEKLKIKDLLNKENFEGTYHPIDFDPVEQFGEFNALHGDWTAYGRLLLADYIQEDRVLYLDSDLVVELDVLALNGFDFDGHILAAVGGGYFRFTLGNKFYIDKLGLSPDLEYFNSGVLLLNLQEWRLKKVKEKCLDIARKYPLELPSHDQSLLNIICEGNFAKLPQSFNCAWIADMPDPGLTDKMIIHFVGSPKPWDPLGFMVHNGYATWKKYSYREWISLKDQVAIGHLIRAWNIRRSYIRCLIKKLRNAEIG